MKNSNKLVALSVCVTLILCDLAFSLTQSAPEVFRNVKYLKMASRVQSEAIDCELKIARETGEVSLVSGKTKIVTLTKSQITHLVYERRMRQRVVSGVLIAWPLLFTKGRQHFLAIQYTSEQGKRDFAQLSLDSSNYQKILETLEAATGVKIQKYTDEPR